MKSLATAAAGVVLAMLVAPAPVARAEDKSLVLYYDMNSIADGVMKDLSGNGNNGKVAGKDVLTDGKFGKALKLDAQGGGVITTPDSPTLRMKGGLTVALWLRFDKPAGRWAGLVKKDAAVPATGAGGPTAYRPFKGFNLGTNGSSADLSFKELSFRFSVQDEKESESVTSDPVARFLEPGKWTHLTASYNPDPKDRGLRLYVNGTLVADKVMISMPREIANPAPLTIGRDLTCFPGAIDEVRLFNRVLSDDEVRALFALQPK